MICSCCSPTVEMLAPEPPPPPEELRRLRLHTMLAEAVWGAWWCPVCGWVCKEKEEGYGEPLS